MSVLEAPAIESFALYGVSSFLPSRVPLQILSSSSSLPPPSEMGLAAFSPFHRVSFNPNIPPESYREAIVRKDANIWQAAMQCKYDSLVGRKVFTPECLPPGCKVVGVLLVYTFKQNPDNSIIRGKEKARLVAQGCGQLLEDYGKTYTPIVKLVSI